MTSYTAWLFMVSVRKYDQFVPSCLTQLHVTEPVFDMAAQENTPLDSPLTLHGNHTIQCIKLKNSE